LLLRRHCTFCTHGSGGKYPPQPYGMWGGRHIAVARSEEWLKDK
jgi:hypothetical protein